MDPQPKAWIKLPAHDMEWVQWVFVFVSSFLVQIESHSSPLAMMPVLPSQQLLTIIIIIIVIIIIIIPFMQGIYTHIPETNYVPREYSVAAIVVTIHGAYIVSFNVV